jgi:serine protease Do
MKRRFYIFTALLFAIAFNVFSQQSSASAGGLRSYVGLINQTYHPGIVAIFEKSKAEYAKRGNNDAVRAIDIFLSGGFGSGFVYSDARGNLYVLTNNHVVEQSHTLSITFESQDGTKRKFENLRIIATDEDADLAILAFPGGELPVTRGLSFVTSPVDEGDDVYSAGFPGLGITPIWQFGRGMVSNASARFPRSIDDDTIMGPFIQHTAQIDAGNSGGPLLVAQRNAVSGYAVAGINTLRGLRRQAANYAIPADKIQIFINNALNTRPETFRSELDQRLVKFTEGLGENRAVFPHIAGFLSTVCIGENAEYAMDEMDKRANNSARRILDEKAQDSIVGALGYAVAWTIENSLRSQGTALNASVKEVTGEGEEYTVVFTINNKDVSSVWIREHGNWRIRSFGTVAVADQSNVERRQAQRETSEKLRIGDGIHIEAGYATLFDRAPSALYISFEASISSWFSSSGGTSIFGAKLYYVDSTLLAFGLFTGMRFGISAGNFGFIPFFRVGIDYQYDKGFLRFQDLSYKSVGLPVSLMAQAGIKVTTSYVPGLFAGAAFQYNILNMHALFDDGYKNPIKMGLSFSAGYAF